MNVFWIYVHLKCGVEAVDVAKRLMDYGFHAQRCLAQYRVR